MSVCLEAAAASTSTASTFSSGTSLSAHSLYARSFAAHEVELVDEVYHHIGVYSIGPRVASHGCADRTADAALFLQDVIPLYNDGGSSLLQEGLAYLCVPYQFVGVHAGIAISSAALFAYVGAETCSPRSVDGEITSVIEAPVVHVGICL